MLRRVAITAGSLTALHLVMSKVYADGPEPKVIDDFLQPETNPGKPRRKRSAKNMGKIKINELPVYSEPEPAELMYIPEKTGAYYEQVSTMRRSVANEIQQFNSTFTAVGDKYRSTKQYTTDMVTYLQEDAGALPRATFITVSGLGGVVLGFRGGVFRKTFLAGVGLATSASICYPHQALDIASLGWGRSKKEAISLWEQARSKEKEMAPAKKAEKAEKTEDKTDEKKDKSSEGEGKKTQEKQTSSATKKDTFKTATKAETVPTENAKKDFGMAKEEDKSMYSTRSS